MLQQSVGRAFSGKSDVNLLYWYKNTNTDANTPARRRPTSPRTPLSVRAARIFCVYIQLCSRHAVLFLVQK